MAILPDTKLLDGTKEPETTTGEFRVAMGNMRDFLADLLGEDSRDKWQVRETLGAAEKFIAEAQGSADAITGNFVPPVKELIHGMTVLIRAKQANATGAPTLKADETPALQIVKGNGLPLQAKDISGGGHWLELKYDKTWNKWVLQNPARGIDLPPPFEDGTTMLFLQTTAPTGWMKLTEHDNKALRIVSGAGGLSGGTFAFTEVFANKTITGTVDNTTLTVEQMPTHVHSTQYGASWDSGGGFIPAYRNIVGPQTFNSNAAGGNQPHTHGFSGTSLDMDIQYVDAIIAMKVGS